MSKKTINDSCNHSKASCQTVSGGQKAESLPSGIGDAPVCHGTEHRTSRENKKQKRKENTEMTMNTYARFVVPEGVQLPPAASGETMPIVSSDEAMREVHKTIEIIRDVMEQKASRSDANDFNEDQPRGKIGHTPYDWIVGTVPACGFAKAKLLGENPATTMYDGECRHECRTGYKNGCFIGYPLGSVLYVLQNGDFVHVDTSLAMVIPACQIRSYIEKTGCPWMFTKARRALLTQLMQAQDGNAQPYM